MHLQHSAVQHYYPIVLTNVALMLTVFRPSVRLSICTECSLCDLTVQPRAKVTIDSLYEVVYEKSIGIKINDLDLCLEVALTLCQPLRHSPSRKSLETDAWFPRTTNSKQLLWNQMVT